MKISQSLFCFAYACLVIAASSAADSRGVQPSPSSNTTLSADENIPSEIKLVVGPSEYNVNVIAFYLNSFHTIIELSKRGCFVSTNGYNLLDSPPAFLFRASESVYPHLINCHIIWAVQRLVSIDYRTRLYRESEGQIRILVRGRLPVVGLYSIKQADAAVNGIDVGGVGSGYGSAIEKRLLLASRQMENTTNPVTLPGDNEMLLDVEWTATGTQLNSIKVFVTIVRALGRLAVDNSVAKIADFGYDDAETDISVTMREDQMAPDGVTYGDLSSSLQTLAFAMIGQRRFEEIQATFFKVESERVNYGIVTIKPLAN